MAAGMLTPGDVTKSSNAKTKYVTNKCRHGEKCRYPIKFMHKDSKDDINNTVQFNQSNEDKTLNLTAKLQHLKAVMVNKRSCEYLFVGATRSTKRKQFYQ